MFFETYNCIKNRKRQILYFTTIITISLLLQSFLGNLGAVIADPNSPLPPGAGSG
jgi:hypothetical protein